MRTGMKVLDMGAGGGYSTELMARAVGPTGVVYGQNPPDQGAKRDALLHLNLRLRRYVLPDRDVLLDKGDELFR